MKKHILLSSADISCVRRISALILNIQGPISSVGKPRFNVYYFFIGQRQILWSSPDPLYLRLTSNSDHIWVAGPHVWEKRILLQKPNFRASSHFWAIFSILLKASSYLLSWWRQEGWPRLIYKMFSFLTDMHVTCESWKLHSQFPRINNQRRESPRTRTRMSGPHEWVASWIFRTWDTYLVQSLVTGILFFCSQDWRFSHFSALGIEVVT